MERFCSKKHHGIYVRIKNLPQFLFDPKLFMHWQERIRIRVQLWPNGLASRRKFKGLVFNLRFVWSPTCDDLRGLWSSSNSYASRCKFFTVWPPNAKSTQVDRKSTEIYLFIYLFNQLCFCDLRGPASRLANPFGHP